MKHVAYGTYSKDRTEEFRQEREQRNREFVKQRIALPSGATFTICRPGTAAAPSPLEEA
jgi:hypothetical protein